MIEGEKEIFEDTLALFSNVTVTIEILICIC
jgi:hypothetical protein